MDRFELRRQDYELTAEQRAIQSMIADFLKAHCPIDVVRNAEPLGFDSSLWERSVALGATRMSLPERLGGVEAGLDDLVVVAEELGRAAAPIPLVEHTVASRLLVALATEGTSADEPAVSDLVPDDAWDQPLGLEVRASSAPGHLILAGAVANTAIVLDNDRLELWRRDQPPLPAASPGGLPSARWVPPQDRVLLASGDQARLLHQRARAEWKILTAALLMGMVQAALDDAVEFAKTRYTRGVPIGSLQAISHPLADMAVAQRSGRNLVRRAAWLTQHEPEARPDLPFAAFVFAARTAMAAMETAVHVQGGQGFSVESAVSLYFLRTRSLVVAGGDPGRDVLDLVDGLDRIASREEA